MIKLTARDIIKVDDIFAVSEYSGKNKKKVIFILKKENNKKAKKNKKIIVELPPGYKFKIFTKAVSDYISNYWDPPVFKKVSKAKNKIESRKYNNDNIRSLW